MSRLSAVFTCTFLVAAGCSADSGPAPARDGDTAMYASEIQPIMRAHCAFLGCHGREGMPLTLYTLDYLRLRDPDGMLDTSKPPLDERALSTMEIDHNRRALVSRIGPDDPAGDIDRFVLRLIPTAAGGIPHADTVVFESLSDPELVKLRQFLETVR